MQLSEKEQKILNRIEELIYNGELSNEFLLQNIELNGRYLNMATIPDFANERGKSYNGVKNHGNIKTLFNVKFAYDNY